MPNIIMADVPSGGPTVYSGTIEFTNEIVNALTVPVDVSNAEEFEVIVYADRTGKVEGGVITYDDNPTIPSVFSVANNAFVWYVTATEQHENKTMYRDSDNLTTLKRPYNVSYAHAYAGNNGSVVGLDYNVVSGTSIVINTMNGNRHFCQTGAYVRFAYTVAILK